MFSFTSKNLEAVRAEPYRKVMRFTFCACIFTDILKALEFILSPETIIIFQAELDLLTKDGIEHPKENIVKRWMYKKTRDCLKMYH